MKKYCPSCGKQNPASAKYCCHCGDSISLTAKVKQKASLSKAIVLRDEDEEDEVTQITATKLDVDIMPTVAANETIGSLMSEGQQTGPVTSDIYETGGGPVIDKKQFLDDFRKEAGPLRGDQTVGEE